MARQSERRSRIDKVNEWRRRHSRPASFLFGKHRDCEDQDAIPHPTPPLKDFISS
jgi:hypothetical protein